MGNIPGTPLGSNRPKGERCRRTAATSHSILLEVTPRVIESNSSFHLRLPQPHQSQGNGPQWHLQRFQSCRDGYLKQTHKENNRKTDQRLEFSPLALRGRTKQKPILLLLHREERDMNSVLPYRSFKTGETQLVGHRYRLRSQGPAEDLHWYLLCVGSQKQLQMEN